jgi:hypothetical protein
MTASPRLSFQETLAELIAAPQTSAPARQIHDLFERLTSAQAPEDMISGLMRYAHSQVAAAQLLRSTSHAHSAGPSLQQVYEALCQQIRSYHTDYAMLINSGAATQTSVLPQTPTHRALWKALGDLKRIPQAATAATKIYELFEKVAASSAPDDVLADLASDVEPQLYFVKALCKRQDAAVGAAPLNKLYESLCDKVRRYHSDYSNLVDARPLTSADGRCPATIAKAGPKAQVAWTRFATRHRPRTQHAYRKHVSLYLRWLDANGIGLLDATPTDVERFFDDRELTRLTKQIYRSAIRTFYHTLWECGLTPTHATAWLPGGRGRPAPQTT